MSASILQELSSLRVPFAALTDIFNTSPTTPAVKIDQFKEVAALLQTISSGGTGQGRIEAYCCDNEAKDNPVEIDYYFRTATVDDVWSELSKAEAGQSSRCLTAVGATLNDQYMAIVRQGQTKVDKPWVYFKFVEVVNDPVVGHATLLLAQPIYAGKTLPVATV